MADPPTILAFDTTAGACSVALLWHGEIVASEARPMTRGHAEALVPMIERVMGAAQAGYDALDAIGVTVGPGAFTGIRIGLATARGIALAAGAPAIGVSTLEALVDSDGDVVAVIDTKRGDFYAQRFVDRVPASEPAVADIEGLGALAGSRPVRLVGDAAAQAAVLLSASDHPVLRAETVVAPDAKRIGALAAARYLAGGPYPSPEPLYISPPQATRPAAGGALRG